MDQTPVWPVQRHIASAITGDVIAQAGNDALAGSGKWLATPVTSVGLPLRAG